MNHKQHHSNCPLINSLFAGANGVVQIRAQPATLYVELLHLFLADCHTFLINLFVQNCFNFQPCRGRGAANKPENDVQSA